SITCIEAESVPRAVASVASLAGLLIETRSLPLAVLILSPRKRFPAHSPIIILRPGEILLVIVNGRLTVSVAGIVILAAKLARVSNRFEHRKNAQAAFSF